MQNKFLRTSVLTLGVFTSALTLMNSQTQADNKCLCSCEAPTEIDYQIYILRFNIFTKDKAACDHTCKMYTKDPAYRGHCGAI